MTTYAAVCLSNPRRTRTGFATESEAEAHVLACLCVQCKAAGWDSACAAEWVVMTDAEYYAAENTGDLLEAGGYEKGEP